MAKKTNHSLIPVKMKTIVKSILAGRKRKNCSKEPILQKLVFTGYVSSIESIPCKGGIYMAFARKETDLPSSYKLLYIGAATGTDCLRNRIGAHINNDHKTEWLDYYNPTTEEIVYSYAVVNNTVRIFEIEDALIFKTRPLVNVNKMVEVSSDAESIILYCKGDVGPLKSRYYMSHQDTL